MTWAQLQSDITMYWVMAVVLLREYELAVVALLKFPIHILCKKPGACWCVYELLY